MSYDSTDDTLKHIHRVQELLLVARENLEKRALVHDMSKMGSPEKEIFDEMTPKLKACTYGSEEYKGFLKEMKVALDHHYANNSHHPEHYPEGIRGMTLLDLLEMICDWKAAGERHADGNIFRSIDINKKRYDISDDLDRILFNTVVELGFSKSGDKEHG
jgi:hypothetical protein